MNKSLLLGGVVVATTALAYPSSAHAGSNCKSTWAKATAKVKKFFIPVGKLVCKELKTDNEEDAKKCIEDLEKFAKDAEEMEKLWNDGDNGTTKIGARGLAHDATETGNVKTERQFIVQPVLGDKYAVTITRTGGKAKKDLIVKVCLVDENGNDSQYKSVKLNKKTTKKTVTFYNAAGTMPLIHLNNQAWGLNGHKYTIRGTETGEADNVAQAKKTMAKSSSGGSSKTKKVGPAPAKPFGKKPFGK